MDREQLEQAFEEHGIRRVKIGGFDIDGVLRGKYVSLDKFWSALDKGFGFCDVIFGWDIADVLYDNAEVTGWHTGYPDALAKLDLERFACCRGSRPPRTSWSTSGRTRTSRTRPARAPCSSTLRARAQAAGLRAALLGRVRVLGLPGDAAEPAREGLPQSHAAQPGHVRLLVGARRPARRFDRRHARAAGRVRHRDRGAAHRDRPRRLRGRDPHAERCAPPTRPRCSRPR